MKTLKKFLENLGQSLKYIGWVIIRPGKAFKSLVNEPKQVTYAIYVYFITSILFAIILIPAAICLRPTGWLPLFFKGIPQNMIYVYFLFTAPLSFILNMLVFSVIEITGLIAPRKDAHAFKSTFSTSMMGLSAVVLLDFITESIPIIYFFITKDKNLLSIIDFLKLYINNPHGSQHFNVYLLFVMFSLYIVMFIWMIILLTKSVYVVKKIKYHQAIASGIVATLFYWLVMTIWIF
jgi:hypothetical protein